MILKKAFRIFAIPLFQDNYSYIIQTGTKDPLMLVDPANPEVILDYLNKYFQNHQVGHILYTHKHWDHAGGSEDLYKILSQKDQKLQVYSGVQDANHIKTVTHTIANDDEVVIGSSKVRVYKVPCHTRGHVVYHFLPNQSSTPFEKLIHQNWQTSEGKKVRVFEQQQCAFSGDTLFCGGIGRFFQGNANQMYINLKKINENIGPKCSIFNGHQYTLQNLKWGILVQPENKEIQQFVINLEKQDPASICTLPTNMKRENQVNVFLRAVTKNDNKLNVESVEYLRILRQAKNNNSEKLEDFK